MTGKRSLLSPIESTRLAVWAIIAITAVACGGPDGDPAAQDVTETTGALVGGTVTSARPEIGYFNRPTSGGRFIICTGTLIAANFVLTAGHCVDFSNTVVSGDTLVAGDRFSIVDSAGTVHGYKVDAIRTLGGLRAYGTDSSLFSLTTPDKLGLTDLAVLHLATSVPSTLATPAVIAGAPPASAQAVTAFGYGCTDRTTTPGAGTKRYFTYSYGNTTQTVCGGDSGGPVVLGNVNDNGAIWAAISGWNLGTNNDNLSNVRYFRNMVLDVMNSMAGTAMEVGIDRPGMDLQSLGATNATACQSACASNEACRAFTWVSNTTTCFLKRAIPNWNGQCPTCTSGIAPRKEVNVDRPGHDLSEVDLPENRVDLCYATCARTPGCAAYTSVAAGVQGPTLKCYLKDANATNDQPGVAVISGYSRGLECNVDRPGGDYRDFVIANDPNQCRQSCALDDRCKAYTARTGATPRCYLKSSVPDPVADATGTLCSGVKLDLEVDTDRPGLDLTDLDLATNGTAETCQAKCAANSSCQAWTFAPAGWRGSGTASHCWLKSGVPAPASSGSLVSGIRGAELW